MSISASSVTLAAWSSSWWGFPAEAVNRAVYSHVETGPVVPGRSLRANHLLKQKPFIPHFPYG